MTDFTIDIITRKRRAEIVLPDAVYTTYMVAYGLTIPRHDAEELVSVPKSALKNALEELGDDRKTPRNFEAALKLLDSHNFIDYDYDNEADYLYVGHKDTIIGLVIEG